MKMKSVLVQLALVAVSTASALNTNSVDAPAKPATTATRHLDDFPKTGLELWLSAGKVAQTDGVITLIKDLSGNANNARRDPLSAVPATNPALATDAISRQPVLRFAGADIAFGFKRLSDVRTAFWVVSKDAAAFGQRQGARRTRRRLQE